MKGGLGWNRGNDDCPALSGDRDKLIEGNLIGDRGHAALVTDLRAMLEKEFGPLPKPAPTAGTKGGKKVGP